MPTARISGGPTLVFLASARFEWRFPEHVGLFLSLLALEKAGCITRGNDGGEAVISAETARAAYTAYAAKETLLRICKNTS